MTPPVFLVEPGRLAAAEAGARAEGAGRLVLDGAEGRHAAVVRRIGPGELVDLSDGAGGFAECRVAAVDGQRLQLDVLARRTVPAPAPRLVVVQALPKGDRGELAVEIMTEVGVDVVVPWSAARCVTRWREDRGAKALGRWRATAREAAKQARRAWLPEVRELTGTAGVVELLAAATLPVVLQEDAAVPLAGLAPPVTGDVVVVVGPEGGISGEELAHFTAAGARGYRLGPTVLRTSTAGTVAAATLLARTARWS